MLVPLGVIGSLAVHPSVGVPLVVNQGVTTTLPNNGLTFTNITQLPLSGHSFFNTSTNKITPEFNGDSYTVAVRLDASSSSQTNLV